MEFDFDIVPVFPNRVTLFTPPVLKHLVKRDSDLKNKYKIVIDALGKSSAEAQGLPAVITLFNKFLVADTSCQLFVLREGGEEERREGEDDVGKDRNCDGVETVDEVLAPPSDDDLKNSAADDEFPSGDGSGPDAPSDAPDAPSASRAPDAPSTSRASIKRSVLGFLKVGPKDLFLHNEFEELVKVRPICVLDFYVNEKCQRRGCGKMLFDHMLDSINGGGGGGGGGSGPLRPRHLAYDRPSTKLLPFLKKHYGLSSAIPQFNKFFIASGFFESDNPCWDNNNNDGRSRNNGRSENSGGGRISQSKSGSFFPYAEPRCGLGGGGGGGGSSSSRSPMTRRWVSEDSVSAAEFEAEASRLIGRNRPKSDVSPNQNGLDADIARGLQNVTIGSDASLSGRFSRHLSSIHPQQPPQRSMNTQQSIHQSPPLQPSPQQSPQRQKQHSASAVSSPSSALPLAAADSEAELELRAPLTGDSGPSRMSARDWTMTPSFPIGSEISNPLAKGRRIDPSSAPTVSSAFIWMPSSSPADHQIRAPYATTSPVAAPVSAASDLGDSIAAKPSANNVNGNQRFQRTSLW